MVYFTDEMSTVSYVLSNFSYRARSSNSSHSVQEFAVGIYLNRWSLHMFCGSRCYRSGLDSSGVKAYARPSELPNRHLCTHGKVSKPLYCESFLGLNRLPLL
jgi:hypothetical protein